MWKLASLIVPWLWHEQTLFQWLWVWTTFGTPQMLLSFKESMHSCLKWWFWQSWLLPSPWTVVEISHQQLLQAFLPALCPCWALLAVVARWKCLWEAGNTSLSCLGGSPGEYFLSPGIQPWCVEWGESVSLGTSGMMKTVIILLVMLLSVHWLHMI